MPDDKDKQQPDFIPAGGPDFIPASGASRQEEAKPSTWQQMTAGYNPDVEQFAERHPILGPPARFLDAAGGAVAGFPQGAYNTIRHPFDTAKGIGESLAAWGKPETWKGAPSVLPEALGAGVGNVAAGEAIPKVVASVGGIPEATRGVKDTVGRATREPPLEPRYPQQAVPSGKLKPWVKTSSQLGGAALGYLAGESGMGPYGGYGGGALGFKMGPGLADMVLPKNPDVIPRNAGAIPPIGSAAQEAGYYPPVTKVPIRPTPDYKVTPESIPGPDTAGKGNLLTPGAKRGDPRMAAELQRRGRSVLYVPAEEYPEPRSRQKF